MHPLFSLAIVRSRHSYHAQSDHDYNRNDCYDRNNGYMVTRFHTLKSMFEYIYLTSLLLYACAIVRCALLQIP